MSDLARRSDLRRKTNAVLRRLADLPPITDDLRAELRDAVDRLDVVDGAA